MATLTIGHPVIKSPQVDAFASLGRQQICTRDLKWILVGARYSCGGEMDGVAEFIVQHAPIGLVATRYRLIEKCSPSFAQMFGYAPEELEGKSLALLYPTTQEFIDIGHLGWEQMKKTRRYGDNRIMKRRDGSQFWCQVHGTSTTREDPFAHCVWSFMDLSHQRPVVNFTRRERQIAMLIVEGLTNKQIGQRLGISHRTIEAHRSRMMGKVGAKTSAELFFMVAGLPA